jgi:hypothetical protein
LEISPRIFMMTNLFHDSSLCSLSHCSIRYCCNPVRSRVVSALANRLVQGAEVGDIHPERAEGSPEREEVAEAAKGHSEKEVVLARRHTAVVLGQ